MSRGTCPWIASCLMMVALDVAPTRGDEPAPATLALDLSRLAAAVTSAIPRLEAAAAGAAEQRACFTCHNQALPVMALVEARRRGFAIDERNLERQLQHTARHLERGRDNYAQGKGQGGGVDTAGYALWTLEAGGKAADETSSAVVEYLLRAHKDSHWRRSGQRPPSEASDFTTSYLALRALEQFAQGEQQRRLDELRAPTWEWLKSASPADTEDRVFRLRLYPYFAGSEQTARDAAADLLAQQRPDGGWAQLAELESDAYATGTTLVALVEGGWLSTTDESFVRGMQFLLDHQQQDGSWHVVTRSKPIQTYFESGFPHGKDQFISASATSWSMWALLLALPVTSSPPQPPVEESSP